MEQIERLEVHESCIVPYRHGERGIEFCLVNRVSGNRWEFPTMPTERDGAAPNVLLENVATGAGLRGHLHDDDPLDAFVAARGNESRCVTAYLMRVTQVEDNWPTQDTHRRLWCLAEEARARLRRKPFRRFIDLALRWVSPQRTAESDAAWSSGQRPKPR